MAANGHARYEWRVMLRPWLVSLSLVSSFVASACWFPGAPIRTTGREVPACTSSEPAGTPCDADDTPSCIAKSTRYECDENRWHSR